MANLGEDIRVSIVYTAAGVPKVDYSTPPVLQNVIEPSGAAVTGGELTAIIGTFAAGVYSYDCTLPESVTDVYGAGAYQFLYRCQDALADYEYAMVSVEVLNFRTTGALGVEKVNSFDADANADLATLLSRTAGGVTVVAPSTLPTGKTRIGKGKRYTGDDRLEYTSDSQRDLSTDHLVALQFNGKSFPADSITGSAGAWTILVPLTNEQSDDLVTGEYNGELAVYDTSPNPDQEIPELASFKVKVYVNR